MVTEARGWFAQPGGGPLREGTLSIPDPGEQEVVVEVSACGLCHTDLGFAGGKVATRHALPLVMGHEIVGRVVAAGAGAAAQPWMGARVLVPAVLPCMTCAFCRAGRSNACPAQKMPGNDIHGGFASHVLVPAGPLVRVGDGVDDRGFRGLGVVADAVSTAYQAALRASLGAGDLAVVVGAGGVGGFLCQVAHALGARVVALDVDQARLDGVAGHGVEQVLRVQGEDSRGPRKVVQEAAKGWGIPSFRHRVFECSGTAAGQALAFGLLGQASTLVFVGFTTEKVPVRLSNLMAFDATAHGSWGCAPEHYPAVLDLVLSGKVALAPFIEEAPLSRVNDLLQAMAEGTLTRRMVLCP